MKNQQNMTIVFLLISAALLSTMLYIAHKTENDAVAASSESRLDPFIMVPGLRATAADNIYIIDIQTKKMAIYITQPGRDELTPKDVFDLGRYFGN
jgi:hypothetical protein